MEFKKYFEEARKKKIVKKKERTPEEQAKWEAEQEDLRQEYENKEAEEKEQLKKNAEKWAKLAKENERKLESNWAKYNDETKDKIINDYVEAMIDKIDNPRKPKGYKIPGDDRPYYDNVVIPKSVLDSDERFKAITKHSADKLLAKELAKSTNSDEIKERMRKGGSGGGIFTGETGGTLFRND